MISKIFIMPHPPVIIPEIGMGTEKEAQITIDGCRRAACSIAEGNPDTIILISPHGPSYSDVVCINGDTTLKGDFGHFGHSEITCEIDNDINLAQSISNRLNDSGLFSVLNDEEARSKYRLEPGIDHGAMVPLHFIQKEYTHFKLVHIATAISSAEQLYRCGMAIQQAASALDKNVVLVASSDLSHRLKDEGPYDFNPEGPKYDSFTVDCIKSKAFSDFLSVDQHMRECAGECGHRAISIALGVCEGFGCDTEIFSYEGPFGVGYMTAGIFVTEPGNSALKQYLTQKKGKMNSHRKNESDYVKLARRTIEKYIKTGIIIKTESDTNDQKGTFVSIKKNGRLRGCIGTISPIKDSIEEEIIYNAVNAAVEDPRFPPITEDELDDLVISVDVLFPPEKIDSAALLDVKKYGVIVSKGSRQGLLLPNLDGIDTVEEQIRIALEKGDIGADENYQIERFKVVRHK